jgi:hypothetical protein
LFSLGIFGLPVNIAAVGWGLFVVINVGWPRTEIYGPGHLGRFAAIFVTTILVALGGLYFLLLQRKRSGVLREHAVDKSSNLRSLDTTDRSIDTGWNIQLATGD